MRATRECTDVLFGPLPAGQGVSFATRASTIIKRFPCVVYKSAKRVDKKLIWKKLKDKEKELRLLRYPAKEPVKRKKKKSWLEKVNERRELAAFYLRTLQNPTIAEVCKMTGSGRKLVKDVMHDLMAFGIQQAYCYNNVKAPERVRELDQSISEVRGTFDSVTDVRRKHLDFSRKWIAKRMRASGFRWLKMARRMRNPPPDRNCCTRMKGVLKHLAQANTDPNVMNIYMDECHFMLMHTASYNWRHDDQPEDELVYNRRDWPEKSKLLVVAACTLERFVAIQIFKRDINADDYFYFLQGLLAGLPRGQKVTVLADNASCHSAKSVQTTKAGKFLFMNSPGVFRANAIENAFSFAKSDWRKRSQVTTIEEEAAHLVRIFFDPIQIKRFVGIAYNHARSLVGLFQLNYGAMAEPESDESSSEDESRMCSENKVRSTKLSSPRMRSGSSSSQSDDSDRRSFYMDAE